MVALRKQSAIVERSFVSTWSGKTYKGWWLDGRMVGCSCPYHAARPHVECKHQMQYNSAMQAITGQDLQHHLEDMPLRGYRGCDYCGRNHKSWNCPF